MLKELLAQLWTNVHNTENTSVRLYESDAITDQEVLLIKNSLFLWCGITLEKASVVLSESSFRQFGGRVLKLSTIILSDKNGLSSFLSLLDEVDDIIQKILSSDSSQFKAGALFQELHNFLVCRSPETWRVLSPLYSALLRGELCVETVRFLRLQSNLLSKIHISRGDLLVESVSEYLYSEYLSEAEVSVQKSNTTSYRDLIDSCRVILQPVIDAFDMHQPLPKHGPGAVSNPSVKDKVSKYKLMSFDARIDYMLRKDCGEEMSLYSPFPLCSEDRTSRVIFVPKTWKKLRGISAEPSGLQFFQQAVLRGILDAINLTDLRHLIDLSCQDKSRKLAKRASRDGTLSTIDLSSASDSVSLQLIKDIFGNTDLCRWLLATRSTHTLIDHQRLELSKFAPMGSACCFPVECLVFAAIVLSSDHRRKDRRGTDFSSFQIYGDDIICPSSISEEVMDNLTLAGFTVNSAKSYCSGDYRESCGMDAWKGEDVTPLKLKDFSFDFNGSSPCSYEHHSRVVSYLNTLYSSGYHHLRSFLLEKFLKCTINLKNQVFTVQSSLVFGDGSRGSLFSCQPDNFHLKPVLLKGYQRYGCKLVGWKVRDLPLSEASERDLFEIDYLEYLMSSRTSVDSAVIPWDLSSIKHMKSFSMFRTRLGQQMIPTLRTSDPWFLNHWSFPN